MPLDSVPPPPPRGKIPPKPKHICSPSALCEIRLSEAGRVFHHFPKGTFRARFIPPTIPQYVLKAFSANPFQWSWTIRDGPRKGKVYPVPTIPTSCPSGAGKALRWVVSLFHTYKLHLNAQALDPSTGRVLPAYLRLYQNNMLVHFRAQLALAKPLPTTAPGPKPPKPVKAPAPPPVTPPNKAYATAAEVLELRKELSELRAIIATLHDKQAPSQPTSPIIAPTVTPASHYSTPSLTPSVSTAASHTTPSTLPWLQWILDQPSCPMWLRNSLDSGMLATLHQAVPDDVPQVIQVTHPARPPLYRWSTFPSASPPGLTLDSGMLATLHQAVPDDVPQVIQVTHPAHPSLYVGFDSNGDLTIALHFPPEVVDVSFRLPARFDYKSSSGLEKSPVPQ
ncbi:hypothetical protein L210DRAFT_3642716 [Boletus edulis BED1]|uniref:Uncharacterized protein n=1 Tax=Boletus edulis BED1 TaxID=1328754 RepID=A0AAD4BZF0_BOLED|nr:hypothetical protein L210DRAFT_3642716 [Boletus edulis BED1]